jgi:hypothetical protein
MLHRSNTIYGHPAALSDDRLILYSCISFP